MSNHKRDALVDAVIFATLTGIALSCVTGCAGFNMDRFAESMQPDYRAPVLEPGPTLIPGEFLPVER